MIDQKIAQTPVFILCGGLGTRLKEETEFRPKPMVPIGDHPILWHIINTYAKFGFKKFILCLGFKSESIKAYFRDFYLFNSDFTVSLKNNETTTHDTSYLLDWDITLTYTGEKNMTGSRIAQATRKFLGNAEHFAVTYGDGLTDANLAHEYQYHLSHNKTGTVLGVNPPSRFGEIKLDGETVVEFAEKPHLDHNWVNGGYFFFNRNFLKYLSEDENCILERDPLISLSKDNQLNLYKHPGFWACMDTQRDREHLIEMVKAGNTPWL